MSEDDNKTLDVMMGSRLVELMRNRDDITEIYINDDGHIRYMSHTEGKVKTDIYIEPSKVQALIELVAGQCGKYCNDGYCR